MRPISAVNRAATDIDDDAEVEPEKARERIAPPGNNGCGVWENIEVGDAGGNTAVVGENIEVVGESIALEVEENTGAGGRAVAGVLIRAAAAVGTETGEGDEEGVMNGI